MQTPFVGSSWLAAKPPAFTIRTGPYLHPEDMDIVLDIDRYDFAVRVKFEDGRPVARKERQA
jgi:2-phosphosulfolactate phosphatase